MTSAFVARQPIHNRSLQVVGYELLYRRTAEDRAAVANGNEATAQVILNTFMSIGLEEMSSGRPLFINVTPQFIMEGLCASLPVESVVLEIVECRDDATAQFLQALDDLVALKKLAGRPLDRQDVAALESLRGGGGSDRPGGADTGARS